RAPSHSRGPCSISSRATNEAWCWRPRSAKHVGPWANESSSRRASSWYLQGPRAGQAGAWGRQTGRMERMGRADPLEDPELDAVDRCLDRLDLSGAQRRLGELGTRPEYAGVAPYFVARLLFLRGKL